MSQWLRYALVQLSNLEEFIIGLFRIAINPWNETNSAYIFKSFIQEGCPSGKDQQKANASMKFYANPQMRVGEG